MPENKDLLLTEIAQWLEDYSPKHNTTDSGWVIKPEIAQEQYKEDAQMLLSKVLKAGYKSPNEVIVVKSGEVEQFISRDGLVKWATAQGYVKLADITGLLHRQGNLWTDRKYELIEAIERIAGKSSRKEVGNDY